MHFTSTINCTAVLFPNKIIKSQPGSFSCTVGKSEISLFRNKSSKSDTELIQLRNIKNPDSLN